MSEASMPKLEIEQIFGLPEGEQIEAMANWLSRLFSETLEEDNERLKARVIALEAMTVRLCDIAKVYMTQEAWLRFDADVQRSVFGR